MWRIVFRAAYFLQFPAGRTICIRLAIGYIVVKMKPETWIGIAQIIITLIAMWLAPWLAVKWSLKQFRSQKWWEEKQEAYKTVLECLSIIRYHYANRFDALVKSYRYEPHEDTSERVRLAHRELELHSATGAYLISNGAAEALHKYEIQINVTEQSERQTYETYRDAASECIDVVKAEARRELT